MSTLSGSLPYLVGRIHLHRRCKHWKSVNWKATYWQGEQHTRSPIGAGKMALQPLEKTSCGASLCHRQTACVSWQNGVGTMWCDNHTVCIREEQKYQDTELNGTTQSRFKSCCLVESLATRTRTGGFRTFSSRSGWSPSRYLWPLKLWVFTCQ